MDTGSESCSPSHCGIGEDAPSSAGLFPEGLSGSMVGNEAGRLTTSSSTTPCVTQPGGSRSRTEQKRVRSAECPLQGRDEKGAGCGDALAPQADYVQAISGDSLAAQETKLRFLKGLHNKRLRQHGPEPSQMFLACLPLRRQQPEGSSKLSSGKAVKLYLQHRR